MLNFDYFVAWFSVSGACSYRMPKTQIPKTVDGKNPSPTHQLRLVVYSLFLVTRFKKKHPRWLFGISELSKVLHRSTEAGVAICKRSDWDPHTPMFHVILLQVQHGFDRIVASGRGGSSHELWQCHHSMLL